MKSIDRKIIKLRLQIRYHDYMYYTLDSPVISDVIYDKIYFRLKQLEKKHEKNNLLQKSDQLLNKIGNKKLYIFSDSEHKTPMLSLDSFNSVSDFTYFDDKIRKRFNNINDLKYYCDFKFDGLAVNLFYKNGILISAATRGDGYVGEDITQNIFSISSVPKKILGSDIPKKLEIRGEVLMKKSDFFVLNQSRLLNGQKIFSNPRNAAAGSLRQLNPIVTKQRKLIFFVYGYGLFCANKIIDSHCDRLIQLKKWGFPVHERYTLCRSVVDVMQFYNSVYLNRSKLDFEIDGIVIKVDSVLLQKNLGYITKYPRWAIALKFIAIEVETKIINVSFQVGRTGIITPVAHFIPINILGVKVSKASLHNIGIMKKLDIRINDFVTVYRAGDVIPKIRNILIYKRDKSVKKIIFPINCLSCGSQLVRLSKPISFYCPAGFLCPEQNLQRLIYFSSKRGINIVGLGKNNIIKLINKGYLVTPVDFFTLTTGNLMSIPGIGKKLSYKIINNIMYSKNVSLDKFICSLGIVNVGISLAKRLSDYYMSAENFLQTNDKILSMVHGVGCDVSDSIMSFIRDINNKNMVLKLIKILNIFYD